MALLVLPEKKIHKEKKTTFNHLFVVINMPTQISHTCLRTGKIFLVKEEQGIPFSTTKISLMWTPHSNNAKYANVIKPGNR